MKDKIDDEKSKVEHLKRIWSNVPQTTLGINKVISLNCTDGESIVEYTADKNMCHSGGIVQGGFITGWLDASMALACMSLVGIKTLVLSLEIKTTFLNVTSVGKVIARGKVVKLGKNIAFLEGELFDSDGNILAKSNQTVKLKHNFYKD